MPAESHRPWDRTPMVPISSPRGGARTFGAAALLLCVLAAAADGLAQRYVEGDDPDYPRLKYADSLTSLNDRCIVAQNKLNKKIRPVYVNGSPIGFC